MSEIVFLSGKHIPYEEAMVPVEDRGYVFADGVYEVVKYYGGRPFRMADHMERLARSAAEIHLRLPMSAEEMAVAAEETVAQNGLSGKNVILYLQVTRGTARRNHAFPSTAVPTIFMIARPDNSPNESLRTNGVAAITVADLRWQMCHVKSTGLLANVLAKQAALNADSFEGVFIRDGLITEGTASNIFTIIDGTLHTHPEGPHILSGVTRQAIIELATDLDIQVVEEPVPISRAGFFSELFITGTVTEVMPIVELDGKPVGTGTPGPITRRLQQAFAKQVAALGRTSIIH